jgi:hypothetical protein
VAFGSGDRTGQSGLRAEELPTILGIRDLDRNVLALTVPVPTCTPPSECQPLCALTLVPELGQLDDRIPTGLAAARTLLGRNLDGMPLGLEPKSGDNLERERR